jgi:hypothetical protein
MDNIMQETINPEISTAGPDMNPGTYEDREFEWLLRDIAYLQEQIDTAKTRLKKEYYTKKLDKARQRVYRHMMGRAMADPSILKKREETNE